MPTFIPLLLFCPVICNLFFFILFHFVVAFALNYVHGFLSKFDSNGRENYEYFKYHEKNFLCNHKLTKFYYKNYIHVEVRKPSLKCSVLVLTN